MRFSSVVATAALAVSFGAASAAHAADTLGAPTAKLTLTAKSADIGLGYTWGDGTLTYAGKAHAFSITGGPLPQSVFPRSRGPARCIICTV